jgi:hypothetical protein
MSSVGCVRRVEATGHYCPYIYICDKGTRKIFTEPDLPCLLSVIVINYLNLSNIQCLLYGKVPR